MRSSSYNFEARVNAYAEWRQQVSQAVRRYEQWLGENGLGDPSLKSRLDQIQHRLKDERMSVAFVAEFSRGKSELINALFFSGYGRRILPSSAGRTTMCPTELMYDRQRKPSIRLLPIETRLRDVSLSDLREDEAEWTEIGLDPDDVESVAQAFDAVRETRRVPAAEAAALGLHDPEDPDQPVQPDAYGLIDIPRWRHAIVNIPDPLLEQGLVVIDTPGLNAIGNEPELTLNLIPSADAVLFVLAADAGVTRSDIEVWRENISSTHRSGRYVVLNKIDGLWDELRAPEEIDREIQRQVESVSRTLALPAEQIYPVSAQKGLAAKIHQDGALLARSRLPTLEHALSTDLVPRQRAVVREHVEREFNELHSVAHSVLQSRRRNHVEQLFELNSLRGKNRNVVDVMAVRIKGERGDFEKGLRQLQALRAVFVRHSQAAYATVSIDNLRRHTQMAREVMRTSSFSLGLREGMRSLLAATRADFEELGRRCDEISTMMTAMYKTFNAEHGFALGTPMLFSVRRFNTELSAIDALYRNQFGAISLMTTERRVLMKRFFESVAARIKDVYTKSHAELEIWLRAVMSPIEGQVREHQLQLRRRLDSVRRVLDASENLEGRIAEIDEGRSQVEQQQSVLSELAQTIQKLLAQEFDAAPEVTEVAMASAAFSAVVSAQAEAKAREEAEAQAREEAEAQAREEAEAKAREEAEAKAREEAEAKAREEAEAKAREEAEAKAREEAEAKAREEAEAKAREEAEAKAREEAEAKAREEAEAKAREEIEARLRAEIDAEALRQDQIRSQSGDDDALLDDDAGQADAIEQLRAYADSGPDARTAISERHAPALPAALVQAVEARLARSPISAPDTAQSVPDATPMTAERVDDAGEPSADANAGELVGVRSADAIAADGMAGAAAAVDADVTPEAVSEVASEAVSEATAACSDEAATAAVPDGAAAEITDVSAEAAATEAASEAGRDGTDAIPAAPAASADEAEPPAPPPSNVFNFADALKAAIAAASPDMASERAVDADDDAIAASVDSPAEARM